MKINHIALYVYDLEGAKKFFCEYFNGIANEIYHNVNTGLKTYFLSFENEARLEIMTRPNIDGNASKDFDAGYIHLAFTVGNNERVDELAKKLVEGGYKILSGPRTTGDGYYEACIEGFEGNIIEIVAE